MKSPAFRIFHSWWGFLVPQYATLSKYTTEHIGLYLPDNKKQANRILSQDTYSTMTIAQAAELLKEGVRIDLNDPKDGVLIYELVMEHLINWFTYLQKPGLIERVVPIEDLRVLANFAEKVFPVANRHNYHSRFVKKQTDELKDMLQSMYDDPKDQVETVKYNHKIIASIEALYRKRVASRRY